MLMRRREMMVQAASTPPVTNLLYNWDFTQSLTDTIAGVVATTNDTWDSNGVHINSSEHYLSMDGVYGTDRTFWVSFTNFSPRNGGTNAKNGRILMFSTSVNTATGANADGFVYRNNNTINFYAGQSWDNVGISSVGKENYFANATLKMYIDANRKATVYKSSELLLVSNKSVGSSTKCNLVIGGSQTDAAYFATITAVQVYDGFVI